MAMKNLLDLKYPMERGRITDWDKMESVWKQIFTSELRVETEKYPLPITEPLLESKANREKMGEVLFEKFNFPAMYVAYQAAMSMFASGRTTGLALQSGEGVTEAVAMVDGYMVANSLQRFSLAGHDLTETLLSTLNQCGFPFSSNSDKETIREVKENLCFVAHDKSTNRGEKSFKLPDGEVIKLSETDRSAIYEAMFESDETNIQKMVQAAIQQCDISNRKVLTCSIILSGGNTTSDGFGERLAQELAPLVPCAENVKVLSAPYRKQAAWIGGSIMASLTTFEQMWVSRIEYDESGPSIISRKCL